MVATKRTVSEVMVHGALMSTAETRSVGAAAETLATAGCTIPSNCHQIAIWSSAAYNHHQGAAPTTSFGHTVAANKPFVMNHEDFSKRKFITTGGGDATFIVIYIR